MQFVATIDAAEKLHRSFGRKERGPQDDNPHNSAPYFLNVYRGAKARIGRPELKPNQKSNIATLSHKTGEGCGATWSDSFQYAVRFTSSSQTLYGTGGCARSI